MIADFFQMIAGAIFDVLHAILSVFPQMPYGVTDVQGYMSNNIVVTMISWMNYFLPVTTSTAIIGLWAAAMMSYVGIKLALKYSNRLK